MRNNPSLLHVNAILVNFRTIAFIDQAFGCLNYTSLLVPMVKVLAENKQGPTHECEDNIDAISLLPPWRWIVLECCKGFVVRIIVPSITGNTTIG